MRILAIGDFHGKFQDKWKKLIKKEKIDIVVSNGDYSPFLYRKLWFENCYKEDVEFWEVVGKKKYKEIQLKEMRAAESVFKKLDKLEVPVITVLGNFDQAKQGGKNDVSDIKKPRGKRYWAWAWRDLFSPILKKYNIKRFDYSYFKFRDYVFIGMNGHSFPGKIKSKAYKKHRKKLEKLFKRFNKKNRNKKVIFVSHNVPYNIKLDKITSNDAPKEVKGKHYGSKLARRIIDKWQPGLSIGGHIHERQGKDRIKGTIVVNTGSAHEGKAAIIDIGKSVKVKFIK